MNLADMLCYADIAQLTKIADAYACECSGHSKNELIQSILSAVQRREALESRVSEMSPDDLRFLNSLLFEQRASYSLEELAARATATSGPGAGPSGGASASDGLLARLTAPDREEAPPARRKRRGGKAQEADPAPVEEPADAARSAISRFKRYGWLFNGASQQTRYLFQVPEDVKKRLCEALERQFRRRLDAREEPPVYRDERSLMEEDVVAFLRFARDYDLPLTAEGVLYKRQLQQALGCLAVSETPPGRSGWRFGYGRHFRDYPDRFSLLYDFCAYQAYVCEMPDRLLLTESGRTLLSEGTSPDPAELYRFWLRLYKGPIPNLAALVQWVARLASGWVTVESLGRVLLPLVRPYYYDSAEDIFRRRVLTMMMHLGLLQWGETEEGESVVRVTPQGRTIVTGSRVAFEDTLYLETTGYEYVPSRS